jgi:hypothetical protein
VAKNSSATPPPEPTSTPGPETGPTGGLTSGPTSGKGRPTPKRKDAEALARARVSAFKPADQMTGQERRKAMRAGDERFMPAKFRGEQMTFIRDWVDHKLRPLEIMLPLLLGQTFMQASGVPFLVNLGALLLTLTLLLIVVDIILVRRNSIKAVAARYPDHNPKGVGWYAVTRAMQLRFMRQPTVSTKVGTELPKRYVWSAASNRWVGMGS